MTMFVCSLGRKLLGALALSAVVGGLAAGLSSASAAERADKAAGAALAQRWCASCHLVSTGQTVAESDVPSFAAIARARPDISPEWLAFGLLRPHPQMPSVSLSREDARNLAAYVESLRK